MASASEQSRSQNAGGGARRVSTVSVTGASAAAAAAAAGLASSDLSSYPPGSSSVSYPLAYSSSSMSGVPVSMPMVSPFGDGVSYLGDASFTDNAFGYLEDMDSLPQDGIPGEEWSNYFWSSEDTL